MVKIVEIVDFLGDEGELIYPEHWVGDWDPDLKITGVSQPWNARRGDISWASKKPNEFKGSLIIIPEDSVDILSNSILCKHPRLAFIKVMQKFFGELSDKDKMPILIEPFQVGKYSEIIHSVIGKNIKVGNSCTIGCEGFGHGKDESVWQRFPQFGKVIIGNNVEIGSNVTICRGAIGNTLIGDNVRIWNQANIGHNCIIGNNSVVLNGAILCGSVVVGNGTWISPGVIVKNKVKIGSESLIALGAVVTKNIPDKSIAGGNPARVIGKVDESTYNMRSY